jgi:o-succinylbenzoate synthase
LQQWGVSFSALESSMAFHFQYRRYRLPFRLPVKTAHGVWLEREGVVVRLEDEAGEVTFGEAAPIPDFGTETVEEVEAACRGIGDTPDRNRLETVPERLGCLRSALGAALAESGRRHQARAAGGAGAVEATGGDAGYLGVAALLPAGRAALAQIGAKAEAGFRVFKWKVGVGAVADEIALLDDLCAALPPGAKLRLDANGAWDRRHAERWLERCAGRPVEFVEQPCFAPAAEGPDRQRRVDDILLGLAADYPTPIGLDESLIGERDLERWMGVGWPGVFVVKPSLLADPAGALARLAAARMRVVFSSALETAVGAQAALRLAFAWPGERRALGFGVWPLYADSKYDGPAAAPFLRFEDVARINPEAVWNALS